MATVELWSYCGAALGLALGVAGLAYDWIRYGVQP